MREAISNGKMIRWFIVTAALVVLSACAALPLKPPEEVLRQRVDRLMTAKVNNDWGTVYDLINSSYTKTFPKENFINRNREIRFSNYRFESLSIDPSGDAATVTVKYDMGVKMFDFDDQVEKQRWIRENGNWYLKVDKEKISATPMD